MQRFDGKTVIVTGGGGGIGGATCRRFASEGAQVAVFDMNLEAAEKVAEQQREQDREKARLRLEEENRKNPGGRLLPEFGSDKDFQLRQALNQLKNQPVLVSKTLTERKEEKKDN